MSIGKLYIVATPIGNLDDITVRAVAILRSADIILCEDTRVSKKLLDYYQIDKTLISYHHHSNIKKINQIIDLLKEGKNIALITDAGTPGISDPGNLLIKTILGEITNLKIEPIPGPSALIAGLSVSGFPTDKFLFYGFPPHKNKRQKFFKELSEQNVTFAFFESGHRIKKCLSELVKYFDADREIVICRELTKKFETIYRGKIHELIKSMKQTKGEFVVIINTK